MKKINIVLIIVGVVIILFAVFCPLMIAEIHSLAWRIIIGLLGGFAFISGIYKIAHKN